MFWKQRVDEDDVDRLNRIWTVLILVVTGIAAIAFVAIFPDAAITCMPTGESNVVAPTTYANMYCLDESAFPQPFYEPVFSYHTFVPLFLFYQALGFISPHVLAQFLRRLFGPGSEFLFTYDKSSNGSDYVGRFSSSPKPTVHNTVIYLLKKVLYLANSVTQLVAIAVIFYMDKSFSGIRDRYYKGSKETPFPRSARCRFDIKDGPTQHFQCAFHINGLYVMFYAFLFYWFLIVAFANLVSLIIWILLLIIPRLTSERIKMYTMSSSDSGTESPGKMQAFVKDCLGKDYLLNLLLAQSTEREATAADLTLQLWKSYEFPPSSVNETKEL